MYKKFYLVFKQIQELKYTIQVYLVQFRLFIDSPLQMIEMEIERSHCYCVHEGKGENCLHFVDCTVGRLNGEWCKWVRR